MKTQPVLILTLIAVLTGAAAAASLLATDNTTEGILAAVGAGITAALGVITRNLVTPLADPKDNEGHELSPVSSVFAEEPRPAPRS